MRHTRKVLLVILVAAVALSGAVVLASGWWRSSGEVDDPLRARAEASSSSEPNDSQQATAEATTSSSSSEPHDSLRALAEGHGLYVGSAIDVSSLSDPTYAQVAGSQFSTVTPENVMKWAVIEPERGVYSWGQADQFMAFAAANHQKVRGHVLVWQNRVPEWLTSGVADGSISTAELRQILKDHITTTVEHFAGRVWQWDVVNEAVTDPGASPDGRISYQGFWYEHLGAGYIADAFRWARAADPQALLTYNDYGIDTFGDGGPLDKAQFVFDMVKELRADGVPVDVVGSQSHLSTRSSSPSSAQIADALEKFSTLGVGAALTEVDVRVPIPAEPTGDTISPLLQAQADVYSALLQGCLSSRHCLSFTVWGFDDGHSWTSTWDFGTGPGAEAMAALYTADYQPKPAFRALQGDLTDSSGQRVPTRITQKPMP